jgi:hypothetical protein
MMLRTVLAAVMGVWIGAVSLPGGTAVGAPAPTEMGGLAIIGKKAARPEFVEARQFQVAEGRVPGMSGQPSSRRKVTAWQVAKGWWDGQSLDGLSLILVQTMADDGSIQPLMNCYVSHLATPAQRRALVSAYAATQGAAKGDGETVKPVDTTRWRIEPAVIRFEMQGERVVVHLGAIA